MNRMFIKVLFVILLAFVTNCYQLFAQNAGPAFSGYIEGTYNYNFSKGVTNSLRCYDFHTNQILLDNAHIVVSGNPSNKVSYDAELDFGTDALVHGLLHQGSDNAHPIGVDVQEAYINYAFSNKFKFTGGRFATFEGIEVIEGPANPTISRGYLYVLAEPFTHVGGYFTLAALNEIELRLGVVNGWDLLIDNNPDKTIISRFGVNLGDPLTFGISYLTGVEQVNSTSWRNSFDLTGFTKIIPQVNLNFQGNYGMEKINDVDAKWIGFTIQPVVSISNDFDLGLRAEYFSDKDGVRTGISNLNAFNFTIVPGLKCSGLIFRFEYRFDNSNKEVFVKENGTSKTSNTVSLGISGNF